MNKKTDKATGKARRPRRRRQADQGKPAEAGKPAEPTAKESQEGAQPRLRGRARPPAGRDRASAGLGQEGFGRPHRHHLRGPRRRRQGRSHQAPDRAGQPAGLPGDGAAGADRAREVADVYPALPRPHARRRRGADLRPQLVQPPRRRAGDGLLHRGAGAPVPRARAALRGGDRRERRADPRSTSSTSARRSRSAASASGSTIRCASGSSARWTSNPIAAGGTTRAPTTT